MTTPDNKRFGDISIEFDGTCNDVVTAAFEMLSYGLGKLPPVEREAALSKIESGSLRCAVTSYVTASFRPYPFLGNNPFAH